MVTCDSLVAKNWDIIKQYDTDNDGKLIISDIMLAVDDFLGYGDRGGEEGGSRTLIPTQAQIDAMTEFYTQGCTLPSEKLLVTETRMSEVLMLGLGVVALYVITKK